ncbi:hypothetical protein P3X46_025060 [Hevea brasiliensis]|uniref:Uncharacterized protein n=1 Tax=Hevea brasiliensis TaxID=3981 RepID=A0ABQ9L7S6_HEVBR|nr:uncharacterized protein LOC110654792 [Hevea brasiliensis]KAJ9159557.1 hypothetical protein P3X46_025060 [Hevea brasiliensis]
MATAPIRSAVCTGRRFFSYIANSSHNNTHKNTHKFLEHNSFIGSWKAPKNPKEAEAKLTRLRRVYAKQVKEVRKEYIGEMELMRIEKQRQDEARKDAIRVANEERKKLKAEVAKARAEERKIAEEEFCQMLLKERKEKLEYWRMVQQKLGEKKKEKNELLRKQSSLWIDEGQLKERIQEAMIDTKLF